MGLIKQKLVKSKSMEEASIKICTAGKKIGYVSQSTILLDDDIKNNIAFGVLKNK